MKKIKLLAIIALAIGIVTFSSCKKDDELTNNNETKTLTSTFNPNEIENMDEYLLGFMKDLKTATRDSEPMLLEDAQWHLSACLNFQFCNANVEKTQVVYDTIYTTINVNDGYVSLNDINASLQEISTEVLVVYNSSDLENKNVLFIKPEIQDDATRSGNTIRTIIATSGRDGDHYYFTHLEYLEICSIIQINEQYHWSGSMVDTLEHYINIYKPTKNQDPNAGRTYYTTLENLELDYTDHWDRIYCSEKPNDTQNGYFVVNLLDSYLGLIEEYERLLNLYYIAIDIKPISITYDSPNVEDYYDHEFNCFHVLYIDYGLPTNTTLPPGGIIN